MRALSPSWKPFCNLKGFKVYVSQVPPPQQWVQNLAGSNTGLIFIATGHDSSYLRNAYKVRMIPARQNPSKNLSVLNIVTFTDSATVSPKIRMKMMENSSTGRRPTLRGRGEKSGIHVKQESSAQCWNPASGEHSVHVEGVSTKCLHTTYTHFLDHGLLPWDTGLL